MKHILIIVNPKSGKCNYDILSRFIERLTNSGLTVHTKKTQFKGHATILAREGAQAGIYSHIVAGGGDGTIAEVSNGMRGSPCLLGILPIGTANVLAYELNIPINELDNADNIIKNVYLTIWPGEIREFNRSYIFLQMLSVGFDAEIVHNTSLRKKYLFGKFAYIISLIYSIFKYKFKNFNVLIDGIQHQATTAIISKGQLYAGKYKIFPTSEQENKKFCVMLINIQNKFELFICIFIVFFNINSKMKRFIFASNIIIDNLYDIPVQSDGDNIGFTPINISISKDSIKVATNIFRQQCN